VTLNVALNALHTDSKVWHGISDVAAAAARATNDLTLSEADLSFASRSTGLLETYEEVRSKAATLLNEAAANTRGLGNVLDSVAYAYEVSEEYGSSRLKGAWDPTS